MSYLHPLRLHFAGKFQANVSTVNNDPGHFDNATFVPDYQSLASGANGGWWNPQGDASWRLLGCRVTGAWSGGAVASDDPVLDLAVADADTRVSAKMADLDCEQQLVSEIWGLQVRLVGPDGTTLLSGQFARIGFMDIWDRSGGGGGDTGACATYHSVLTQLVWGDIGHSAFLRQLRELSPDKLSIKFNLDGYSMDYRSPDFTCGRIAGTIGPALSGEPDHLVLGRHLIATPQPGTGGFFSPAGLLNHCAAVVTDDPPVLLLDLGNALPTTAPGTAAIDLGDLLVSVAGADGAVTALGTIPAHGADGYTEDAWYGRTAGVVGLPLAPAQHAAAATAPLTISGAPQGAQAVYLAEPPCCAYVRADQFVYRLSPGTPASIAVHAMRWGRPLAGAALTFFADPSQLQPANDINAGDVPPVAVPLAALPFEQGATTDAAGKATLRLTPGDPGTPRWFDNGTSYGLDGQIYGIRPMFADPTLQGPINQWAFVSVLLFSGFSAQQPVTWDALQPIFQQYANLYPVMNRFLDLGDYEQVVANAGLLKLAFGLDPADPNAMPVTRDLSPAKRDAILAWLDNPLRGAGGTTRTAPAPRPTTGSATPMLKGGKAAAAARRIVVRQ